MLRTAVLLLLASAFLCYAEVAMVKVEATLDSGSQAGKTVPVTIAYDSSAVVATGDCVVPATPVGDNVTILQRADAVFKDGILKSVHLFLRMDDPNSPIHNLVIGLSGPDSLTYVDQDGRIGSGTFRVTPISATTQTGVIRFQPDPSLPNPLHSPALHTGPNGLVIFAPELPGTNPLNVIRAPAAPGLLVIDPAPLTLQVPIPPR